MALLFHAELVNEPVADPALYVDFLFERRALLFDMGSLERLTPKKILRLSHAFVSHTHMDHFVGFDRILRTCLYRDRLLHVFGPPRFIEQVEHKLAAYTWNLVHAQPGDFTLVATEVHPGLTTRTARFRCRRAFQREEEEGVTRLVGDALLEEDAFRVRVALLDHKIPVLAFALEEKAHLNVWKARLLQMGLVAGPWLGELKRAVMAGRADATSFRVWWREGGAIREQHLPLGVLRERLLSVTPGQKIAYVVDAAGHDENAARIVPLARGADLLFVEAPFLDEDARIAAEKAHLTAGQAGRIAREAGVKRVIPFHLSPRYLDGEARVRKEVRDAFAAPAPAPAGE